MYMKMRESARKSKLFLLLRSKSRKSRKNESTVVDCTKSAKSRCIFA